MYAICSPERECRVPYGPTHAAASGWPRQAAVIVALVLVLTFAFAAPAAAAGSFTGTANGLHLDARTRYASTVWFAVPGNVNPATCRLSTSVPVPPITRIMHGGPENWTQSVSGRSYLGGPWVEFNVPTTFVAINLFVSADRLYKASSYRITCSRR